jgi:hypothetical protein
VQRCRCVIQDRLLVPSIPKTYKVNVKIFLFYQLSHSITSLALLSSITKFTMDEDDLSMLLGVIQAGTIAALEIVQHEEQKSFFKTDHRTLPRSQRRIFRHHEALNCIRRDYLGKKEDLTTLFFGAEFTWMFRVSRGRFRVLMEVVMGSGYDFLKLSPQDGFERCSTEARLLLPLKTFAYGVPPHTFIDYFQMSAEYARDCCLHFAKAVKGIYTKEYLRCPTKSDLKSITRLHKQIHGTDGMLGSLDCTHTYWKNCPKAWQGS